MDRWPQRLRGLALGGDYNPEQWPEETWTEDVALMKEAGVGFATVGVFAWARLEPVPGRFDFGWLDRVLDLLHAGGVAVDLATATASPPPWLTHRHPEVLPVDREGHRLWPGSRQAWCPSSPVYRELSLHLVEAVASRYAEHPALAMWHVSNELGCHNARCYCDVSAAAFRDWLLQGYGDVDVLNEAWGTSFWSQAYSDVAEVLPPRLTTAVPNPTHQLDFDRFSSDALLSQFVAEREVLARITPDVLVTTNFMTMPHVTGMDYWRWAPHQDVVSTDHYLDGRLEDPHAELAFSGDLTRGLAGGGPWFLMEHSTSAVNWQPVNYAKAPGQLVTDSLSHVARGADAVGFFQWRASRAGAEKFHSAMLPHAGTGTALWREVVELGAVLGRLDDVVGTTVAADVAVVFDWDAWWACDQPSHPSGEVTYTDQVLAWHGALRRAGVVADVAHPGSDLSRYRLVVVPTLYLCDDSAVQRIGDAVAGGAHVVVTYFSGIVDEHDHVRLGGYPGAFADLLGVHVEQLHPLRPGETVTLDDGATASTWTEHLHLRGADAAASYADGPLPGVPAVTWRDHAGGRAWYVATRLGDAALDALLARVLAGAGVEPVVEAVPPGVDVVRRTGADRSFLFVLNHSDHDVTVPARGTDLVTGDRLTGTVRVPGQGAAVVREEP